MREIKIPLSQWMIMTKENATKYLFMALTRQACTTYRFSFTHT